MNMIQWFGDLLLSQWIWSMTFDLSHYVFSFCIMFFILFLFTKDRFINNFLLSLFSIIFSFAALFFIATIVLDTFCNWHYCPLSTAALSLQRQDVMKANLSLACFLTLFQCLFFILFSYISRYKALPYCCVILLSNAIAALCSYGYIITTMHHLF